MAALKDRVRHVRGRLSALGASHRGVDGACCDARESWHVASAGADLNTEMPNVYARTEARRL